jgi:DNA repair exonuclease SbcCD ATPase subunit
LESERRGLVLEEKKNPIPEKPKDFDTTDLAKLNKGLVCMEQDLERSRKTLKVFETESTVACPTCGTAVHELEEHLAACKKLVASYPAKITALEDVVEKMDNYKSQATKYSKWLAGWSARMKANQEARDALKDLEEPDGPKEALEAAVTALEDADKEIEETQDRLNKAIKRVATATSAVEACKRRLAEIGQGITENTVDSDKVSKVKKRLAEHTEAQKKIANIEGQISGKQDQIEEAKEEVKKLKAKLKRSKRVRKMVKILGRARDVLHRDCLPNRVAQINLGRMEGDVNEGLGYFGNPFWVESDANLQFLVHKPGEPAQRAGQLSTGLRVVLAIPFWLAVASLWKNEIGMLALDEPTANLDEDNRAFLAEALSALTVKMKGSRQIVMVTHADNLKASFDQVIDVG